MKLKPKQLSFILLSVALKYKKQQKNQKTFSLDYSYISYELHQETITKSVDPTDYKRTESLSAELFRLPQNSVLDTLKVLLSATIHLK